MTIGRYCRSTDREEWDAFVRKSKNATFLHLRDYMDYHSDRFDDCSLVVRDRRGRIVALLPANRVGSTLNSHGGLTYGGWLMDSHTAAPDPMAWMAELTGFCHEEGIDTLVYKAIPHIYHQLPAEEDLYALWRAGAQLTTRNVSTAIALDSPSLSRRLSRRAVLRKQRFGIAVRETDDADEFWDIVVRDRRERHNVKPVHTAEELNRLHRALPEYIRMYVAEAGGKVLAGAVIYDAAPVLHLQYAAATEEGKRLYATDVIYREVIDAFASRRRYFDFGISNEDAGRYLNTGMTAHKEELGGRTVVYDIYTMSIKP